MTSKLPKTNYVCLDCGRVTQAYYSKWSSWIRCSKCEGQAFEDDLVYTRPLSDTFTGQFKGFNHGLDTYVENYGHFKHLLKEQNVRLVER